MTFGSVLGILATLGFVLVLLGLALKLLRRFAPTTSVNGKLRMEVVQRLALGPKQGIAVVAVGQRLVAISVGEGGIHRLFELEESEAAALSAPAAPATEHKVDFSSALRGALRTAGLAVVAAAMLSLSATKQATAQSSATRSPAATQSAAASAPMVSKLAAAPGASSALSQPGAPAVPQMDVRLGGGSNGGLHLSGTVSVVVMMGLLTLLPTLLLMMTGF
ncbi:MAG TPA: flagellar biosynthetic protein FliO, partial [Gemmatimonadaceae bacterium]